MVDALHNSFEEAVQDCFDTKFRKKKSSEPVWMTDEIRDLIRKRRKLFRRMKRRGRWIFLKKLMEEKIKKKKKGHARHVKQKFLDGDSRSFFRSVTSIMKGNEEEMWDIRSLFPGRNDSEVANLAADFFNGISRMTIHSPMMPLSLSSLKIKLQKD